MPDATTIKIITPVAKRVVEIKGLVTGFDQEAIDNEYYTESDIPAQQRANRKSFEVLVVSVDDSKEDIVNTIMGMDLRDYRFVISKLNDLTLPLDDSKKKSSTSAT